MWVPLDAEGEALDSKGISPGPSSPRSFVFSIGQNVKFGSDVSLLDSGCAMSRALADFAMLICWHYTAGSPRQHGPCAECLLSTDAPSNSNLQPQISILLILADFPFLHPKPRKLAHPQQLMHLPRRTC